MGNTWSVNGALGGPLDHGRPEPAVAAVRLPVPHVDPDDPAADALSHADALDPQALLGKLPEGASDSVEVHLARCRAHLALGEHAAATEDASRAAETGADRTWRTGWHEGLLALARNDLEVAELRFGEVYQVMPGEAAPKLALGYCAESRGDLGRAEGHYQAVWSRNRHDISAAFGLARVRLARGERAQAVLVLDGVPKVSRHADAADIAAVMILAARVGEHDPEAADLLDAARRLRGIYLDGGAVHGEARVRLTTVIREAAFDWAHRHHDALSADDALVFGDRTDENGLRLLLEQSYRELSRQARNAEAHGVLVDRANTFRPLTVL